MKIAVNLTYLQPQRNRGAFTYAHSVLCEMAKEPETELILIVTKNNGNLFLEIPARQVMAPISGRNRVSRIIYEQLFLVRLAQKIGCDVLFCPGYLAPVMSRIPVIVSILDMQFRDVPRGLGIGFKIAYNLIVPLAARRAASVITISEFSKRRILYHLGLKEDRVQVTHLAALHVKGDERTGAEVDLRRRYNLGRPFLLSVSTSAPYKNVGKLIDAFINWKNTTNANEELVLVGHHRDWFAINYPNAESRGVRLLGFLAEDDLKTIYRAARAFILASSYEGFGLPILEAMQFNLPVACSNCASLPEVAGAAALYFDPMDQSDIVRAIDSIITDDAIRSNLLKSIPENLRRFSWRKCATETVAICRAVTLAAPRTN